MQDHGFLSISVAQQMHEFELIMTFLIIWRVEKIIKGRYTQKYEKIKIGV